MVEYKEYPTDDHYSTMVETADFPSDDHYSTMVETADFPSDNHYSTMVEAADLSDYSNYSPHGPFYPKNCASTMVDESPPYSPHHGYLLHGERYSAQLGNSYSELQKLKHLEKANRKHSLVYSLGPGPVNETLRYSTTHPPDSTQSSVIFTPNSIDDIDNIIDTTSDIISDTNIFITNTKNIINNNVTSTTNPTTNNFTASDINNNNNNTIEHTNTTNSSNSIDHGSTNKKIIDATSTSNNTGINTSIGAVPSVYTGCNNICASNNYCCCCCQTNDTCSNKNIADNTNTRNNSFLNSICINSINITKVSTDYKNNIVNNNSNSRGINNKNNKISGRLNSSNNYKCSALNSSNSSSGSVNSNNNCSNKSMCSMDSTSNSSNDSISISAIKNNMNSMGSSSSNINKRISNSTKGSTSSSSNMSSSSNISNRSNNGSRSTMNTLSRSSSLLLVLGALVLCVVIGPPVAGAPGAAFASRFIGDTTQRYLMQYGYLPQSDMEMGNLRTDHELVEAVRRLQRFGRIPVTGVVDEATKELMQRPRCSLPDIPPPDGKRGPGSRGYFAQRNSIDRYKRGIVVPHGDQKTRGISVRHKRYIKQGSAWPKTHLTWGIISYPGGRLDGRAVERELHLATELWARPSKLTFSQLTDKPGSADIVVQFNRGYHGDGYPFDGEGRTLAHAFYPGTGIGGDIHFDADERWVQHLDSSNSSYDDISLFLTASHELGHSLGLYHSQARNSIMSPYLFSHGPGTFTLPRDDVAGIQDLYGANEDYHRSSPSGGEEGGGAVSDLPPIAPSPPTDPPPTVRPPSTGPPTPPLIPLTHPTPFTPPTPLIPDACDTDYDALSVIRRGIYIFRGKYFWRVDNGSLSQEPVELTRFWYCLPKNVSHVDALYERPNQETIVFFSGPYYYVCEGNDKLVDSGPLRKLGLPASLQKLDAAFVWSHNSRTYFMADTMYWRFDESVKHVELDYPRDMLMWKGVPYGGIDAAFTFSATTYFFKGKLFYEFDDLRMKVRPKSPVLTAPFWLGCPNNVENRPSRTAMKATSGAHAPPEPPTLSFLTFFVVFLAIEIFTGCFDLSRALVSL